MIYFRINDREIGAVSMDDALWLSKMNIIETYDSNKPWEQQLEALPVTIDYQLPWRTAQKMKHKAETRRVELERVPGFRSRALDSYIDILTTIVEAQCPAQALCD